MSVEMWDITAAVCLKTHCSVKSHRKPQKKSKVFPIHAVKAYRGVEVYLHPS